ncbi:MAG: hypothetical protein AAF660_00595 [Pseudomonadota bacterium]
MELMQDLITGGRIVDIVLVVMGIELVVSAIIARRRGIPLDIPGLAFNIGAGASLALALRASLTGDGWQWIAVWLISSLVFHVLDISRRWQQSRR